MTSDHMHLVLIFGVHIHFYRFSNTLDEMGGSTTLAQKALLKKVESWNHPFGAIVLGIRQLGLSGFKREECMAIENEIIAWQSAGIFEKEGMLYFKKLNNVNFP